jgi:hypothetical protein
MAKKAKKAKAKEIVFTSTQALRGERMTKGTWRMLNTSNGKFFKGSLVDTINMGNKRLAIFSVPK